MKRHIFNYVTAIFIMLVDNFLAGELRKLTVREEIGS